MQKQHYNGVENPMEKRGAQRGTKKKELATTQNQNTQKRSGKIKNQPGHKNGL